MRVFYKYIMYTIIYMQPLFEFPEASQMWVSVDNLIYGISNRQWMTVILLTLNNCWFCFFVFFFFPPVYTVFGLSFLSCGAWSSETFPRKKNLTPDCLSLNRQCLALCCWETPSHWSVFNSFMWWFSITNQRFSSHCPDVPFPANLSVPSSKQTLLPCSLSFVIPTHPMFTGAATEIWKVVQNTILVMQKGDTLKQPKWRKIAWFQ